MTKRTLHGRANARYRDSWGKAFRLGEQTKGLTMEWLRALRGPKKEDDSDDEETVWNGRHSISFPCTVGMSGMTQAEYAAVGTILDSIYPK